MHLTPKLVHHPASGLRKPVIDTSKQTEDGAWSDDVMEMRDDVIGVVQIKIGGIKCQRNAGEATNAEHREKSGRKKHRRVESNRPAPERNKKCAQNNDGRNGNDQSSGLEKRAHGRSHAGEPHVMGPDNEGEKTKHERGEDEGFVTPERF